MNAFIPDYQTPERMAAKRQAIPLPSFAGKRVLDVGCDHGYWSFLAAELGAALVLGLERNRDVRGRGFANLVAQNNAIAQDRRFPCGFAKVDLGKQWCEFGAFDVVFVLSVYHHIYENCGSHAAVWLWLYRHCSPGAIVLWEGPVDDRDPVVRANVSDDNRPNYRRHEILQAAAPFFDAEHLGPALHEPTREVWRFTRRAIREQSLRAAVVAGAGGATPAFLHHDGRRIREFETILGFRPYPGSLNLKCDGPFWHLGGYRARVLDVRERAKGLDSEWVQRWARFTPVEVEGVPAVAFRFEGDSYRDTFVELVADRRLRDVLPDLVTVRAA